jgi:hypothetical protein
VAGQARVGQGRLPRQSWAGRRLTFTLAPGSCHLPAGRAYTSSFRVHALAWNRTVSFAVLPPFTTVPLDGGILQKRKMHTTVAAHGTEGGYHHRQQHAPIAPGPQTASASRPGQSGLAPRSTHAPPHPQPGRPRRWRLHLPACPFLPPTEAGVGEGARTAVSEALLLAPRAPQPPCPGMPATEGDVLGTAYRVAADHQKPLAIVCWGVPSSCE